MMNLFHLLGYDTSNQYPKNSVTSVGPFALVPAGAAPSTLKVYLGAANPTNIYVGNTIVQSIYVGSTLVWQK